MRSRKQIPILIPVELKERLARAIETEATIRGLDRSDIQIAKKEIEVAPGILMTWQVYYVNTAGFRKYVSHANESGRALAILSRRGSVELLINLNPSDLEVIELGSGDYEISGEVPPFSTTTAKNALKHTLSSRLRVPKKAVNVTHKQKILYVTRIRAKILSGEGLGFIEVGGGSGEWKVKWDPLRKRQLKDLAIQLAMKSNIFDKPETEPLTGVRKGTPSRKPKAGAKRSWDAFFGSVKRDTSLLKGSPAEETSGPKSPSIKVLSERVDDYYGVFVLCRGGDCGIVALNRYSGLEISKFPLPSLKEIEDLISRHFIEQFSARVLKIEEVEGGNLDAREYSLEIKSMMEGTKELIFLTRWSVKLESTPMRVLTSLNMITRDIDTLYVEPDESRMSDFLEGLLGKIETWESQYDPPNLYVKAKPMDGSWELLRFSAENLSEFSPEDHLVVEGAVRDPSSKTKLLFCRDMLRAEGGCRIVGIDVRGNVLFNIGAPCMRDLLTLAHSEISSKYDVRIQLNIAFETDPDVLAPRLPVKDVFTGTQSLNERASVYIEGTDTEEMFDFMARYDVMSGTLGVEAPKIREGTPQRIAQKLAGPMEIRNVKWKYSYPVIKIRLKTGEGALITLKVDFSSISNPRIVERKAYEPSTLNFIRWILPL